LRHTHSICALGLCCLLAACADSGVRERGDYIVRPQDTLYSIAWRYGLDFHDLARWNHIGPDFRIAVGQRLILAPTSNTVRNGSAPRRAAQLAPGSAPAPGSGSATGSGSASAPKGALPQHLAPAPILSALPWVWPTDRMAAPQAVQGGGILLPGRLGQDIRAASSGRVVYNGTGIRGYGNLIIIKHGENLLSAYAHNRESLVREGQEVTIGEVIGHMGEGAPQKPVLYFEIRRNGKPIDPLALLPRVK
jgi:lipoprotein NlpD